MITGLYAGLLALWMVFLMVRVVLLRRKYRVGLGDGGHKELTQAIRIHGNFTETVPLILIMMGLMEYYQYDSWILHGFGIGLIVSRILHWRGISQSATTSPGRFVGTAALMTLALIGGVLLIYNYIVG